jgi:hypothetical protein
VLRYRNRGRPLHLWNGEVIIIERKGKGADALVHAMKKYGGVEV